MNPSIHQSTNPSPAIRRKILAQLEPKMRTLYGEDLRHICNANLDARRRAHRRAALLHFISWITITAVAGAFWVLACLGLRSLILNH